MIGLGEAQGLKLFRDIVATNGISVRHGHSVLNNLIVAGEVPLALTVYGFLAEQSKLKGAPLDWFIIPPLMARPTVAGVSRNAPQPHAAVLFYDFLIGDAQPILASRQFVSPSRKIELAVHRATRCSSSNSVEMLDNAQKWQDLYQSIVITPRRAEAAARDAVTHRTALQRSQAKSRHASIQHQRNVGETRLRARRRVTSGRARASGSGATSA